MDYRILIAEDDSRLREVLCDFFLSKGDSPFRRRTARKPWPAPRKGSLTRCSWTS